jgi:SAM-dependent methyltransferase
MKIRDILFLPLRILLSHDQVNALGLTSLLEERMNICAKYINPPLLDIGCGEENFFIRQMGIKGYGLDAFQFKHIDICADANLLPFKDKTFQTVSFVGSFNYMKNTSCVLKEVKRVLHNHGVLLITITNAFWSKLRHTLAWWDKEQNLITQEVKYGFSDTELEQLLIKTGFQIIKKDSYFLGVSKIFVALVNEN